MGFIPNMENWLSIRIFSKIQYGFKYKLGSLTPICPKCTIFPIIQSNAKFEENTKSSMKIEKEE